MIHTIQVGYHTARDRLATLVQKTSVVAYIEEFLTVVLAISSMTEEEKVDKFTRGLRGQVHREVQVRQYNTLQDAMTLATRVDSMFIKQGWQARGRGAEGRTGVADESVPMELGQVR